MVARSLRDELLKAGLVTSEQTARAERGSRPPPKPGGSRASRERGRPARIEGSRSFSKPAGSKPVESRAAERTAKRRSRNASRQRLPGRAPGSAPALVEPPADDPEAQVRQLNLRIRHILDTEAEKAEAESDAPFHFTRGDRIKRLYVSGDQRRRLSSGELAIVGFRGRHHLVPRAAGEQVRELRPEVFVFIAAGEDGAGVAEEGYEGYEIPDELVW